MSKKFDQVDEQDELQLDSFFPLNKELLGILEREYEDAQHHKFPEYHPYAEAIKRALQTEVLTLISEKVIARHCFYVCAEIIRDKGPEGRSEPVYQHYLTLLKKLPTDWFDDQKGKLLDEIEILN